MDPLFRRIFLFYMWFLQWTVSFMVLSKDRHVMLLGHDDEGFIRFCQRLANEDLAHSFRQRYRMHQSTYIRLYGILSDDQDDSELLHYKLFIFLSFVYHNHSLRTLEDIVEVPRTTLYSIVREVALLIIKKMYEQFVSNPAKTFADARADRMSRHAPKYRRMYEFFNGATAMVDGTLVKCYFNKGKSIFRSRKKQLQYNIMVLTDMMGRIRAFEVAPGSYHDSKIFSNTMDYLRFPEGSYILGDKGFTFSTRLHTPFRSVDYNVDIYGLEMRPRSFKELYNRLHSGLRMRIERVFGDLKSTFPFVQNPRMHLQKFIIVFAAIICLYNFIRETEGAFDGYDDQNGDDSNNAPDDDAEHADDIQMLSDDEADADDEDVNVAAPAVDELYLHEMLEESDGQDESDSASEWSDCDDDEIHSGENAQEIVNSVIASERFQELSNNQDRQRPQEDDMDAYVEDEEDEENELNEDELNMRNRTANIMDTEQQLLNNPPTPENQARAAAERDRIGTQAFELLSSIQEEAWKLWDEENMQDEE